VTAPDGSVTQYSYYANQVTIWDAAMKWKTQTFDALGNLGNMTEPDTPNGFTNSTTYTYDGLNNLSLVTMQTASGTQQRMFTYSGLDLTSQFNPENGTVYYTYDPTVDDPPEPPLPPTTPTTPADPEPASAAPTVSLREESACTEAHGQLTGNFTLDVTYQLIVNGTTITGGNSQMSSLGIYFISEQLTNETGGMKGTTPGAWCQTQAGGMCAPGDLGELNSDGTFTDYLSGQGTLTQSFYLNGTGAALGAAFPPSSGFVGPLQLYYALNNTYDSTPMKAKPPRRVPPSITVAGGAVRSVGLSACN
jgi:hypothetical protein